MKCPQCQTEVTEHAKFCSECGYNIREADKISSEKSAAFNSNGRKTTDERNVIDGNDIEDLLKLPTGLKRTFSTEFVARKPEVKRLAKLCAFPNNQIEIKRGPLALGRIFVNMN